MTTFADIVRAVQDNMPQPVLWQVDPPDDRPLVARWEDEWRLMEVCIEPEDLADMTVHLIVQSSVAPHEILRDEEEDVSTLESLILVIMRMKRTLA